MTDILYGNWRPVIGLEVHAQLKTRSKLFCEDPNRFGDEPNSNISEVSTGQPGSLPVLNKEAVRKAVQLGLALKARIAPFSAFDRKSYFYPDSPRNYQITQFDYPILLGGFVTAEVLGHVKHFSVNRAHLEDDAGMLKHFSTFAGVDFNRAGAALIEIVFEPCMSSPKEAAVCASALRAILQYLDVSDGNMEEGSLRIDANISVHLKQEKELRPKVEIKNMNSFSNMELAIEAEIRRQIEAYERCPHGPYAQVIEQGTYRFDLETKKTRLMRRKEAAAGYRYFPDPDLPPLVLTDAYIEEVRRSLPELPAERLERYVSQLGLSVQSALVLVNDKALADYFEGALSLCPHAKTLCNWVMVECLGRLKDLGISISKCPVPHKEIARIVNMTYEGKINGKIAKLVADDLFAHPEKSVEDIVLSNPDYQPLNDVKEIESIIEGVLQENPQSIADFKAGRTKAFAYLVGQVMKLSKGKASPALVNDILTKKLQ